MTLSLLCLAGDGIGPEIMAATKEVVEAACAKSGDSVILTDKDIGFAALNAGYSTIPESVIEAAHAVDGVILGPVSHNAYPPKEEGGLNPSGVLRKELDLYANIRPAKSFDGLPTPTGAPVDLVIFRENLEGFYADRNLYAGTGEFMPVPGVAMSMRLITERGSERIARAAFDFAGGNGRKKVTAVHKANVMRTSDGLFLEVVRRIAAEHPDIQYDEVLVDAAAALLVRDPDRFDVIVTTNMFGDILSDLSTELAGGLGLAASLNLGSENVAAQAQHGSAPDIAGQDRANPTSLVGSAAMLLGHLGLGRAETLIEQALKTAIANPLTRTADLGGPLGTRAFASVLVDFIQKADA
ncbi:isocitrate/isopropylmalate dehydrogenase family protein [Roseibium sp. MMSF_3544]|uniref:isocitrate/isopropylmalate dehydrogenase family protein n=1 Tax=unclassified Roseibium TaxID=2629323 RepID=UPI00273EC9B8|nr:isocitrate/isopropylmalate dehydrogenase family protein [Roseibium sp. MMSF_3544]